MSDMSHAIQLIVDGYTVVPDVFDADELAAASDAFERAAAKAGKRQMGWDELREERALMNYLGHPRLMGVVEAFCAHFDEKAIVAGSSGTRDAFGGKQPEHHDYSDLAKAPLGWHDDVRGVKVCSAHTMQLGLTALLYLDETFKDNGAYCAAAGSHHLARVGEGDQPIFCPPDVVLDHCRLVQLPVKPGAAIIHRAHNWHGVVPAKQRRRLILQHLTSDSVYDAQVGHTQLTQEDYDKLPADRHRFFRSYSRPT